MSLTKPNVKIEYESNFFNCENDWAKWLSGFKKKYFDVINKSFFIYDYKKREG